MKRLQIFLLCLSFMALPTAHAADPAATLVSAGGATGGAGFITLTTMAKVVKDKYGKVDISVTPGAYIGNIQRVDKGDMDLGATANTLSLAGTKGLPPFKSPMKNYYSLFNVQESVLYFIIVPQDFPVDTVPDLLAKKIPVNLCTLAPGSQTELVFREAFKVLGVTWDDLRGWGSKLNFVTWGDAVSLFKDGHANMVLAATQGKAGWIMELANSRKLKFLHWGPDLPKIHKAMGTFSQDIPANSFEGVSYPVTAIGDGQEVVINAKIKDDLAYALTKAVAEGEETMRSSRAGYDFRAAKMSQGLGAPIHPGALRYYKEKGYVEK